MPKIQRPLEMSPWFLCYQKDRVREGTVTQPPEREGVYEVSLAFDWRDNLLLPPSTTHFDPESSIVAYVRLPISNYTGLPDPRLGPLKMGDPITKVYAEAKQNPSKFSCWKKAFWWRGVLTPST